MIDAKLLNRVLQKDTTAYENLFNQIYPDAYRLAFSFTKNAQDAEDAVQDAMIKIFKKIDTLKNVNSFKSWSNTIIVNSAKDVCKKKNKNPYNFSDYDDYDNLDFEEAKEEEDTEFNPEDIADKHELISVIDEIMSNLTEDQKICLQLRYYNDLQIKDIAKALDIPENTVKTRISRGRRKFELIAKEYEKKGFSLFGVSAIPFFFDKSFKNLTIPAMSYSKVIAPALATSAAVGATATGTTIGGAVVGKSAAVTGKVVAVSTIKKVIAGIAITGIIAGGTETAITIVNQKRSIPVSITETTERTIESTTDRIKDQSQSTTENDNYANKSYSSNNMCGTPYVENKDYEFISYYFDNSSSIDSDLYDENTQNTLKMLSKNEHNTIWSIKNAYALYMILIDNYLFYLNENDHYLYSININNTNPTPNKVSIDMLITADGHPPSSALTRPSLNFYYKNGKILYISKYENAPYTNLACAYDVKKGENKIVVKKDSYSGLYVNSDGIVDSIENILYDELGNKINNNYSIPKLLTVFENDFSVIQENTEDGTYIIKNKLNNKEYISMSQHCPYFDATLEKEIIIEYTPYIDDSTNITIEHYPLGTDGGI